MSDVRLPSVLDDDDKPEKPSASRMYDYMLGGFNNYAVDRQAVARATAIYADIALVARANRAFLRRSVTYLVGQGIVQFLDLGSGIPTVGNVHEVAQRHSPDVRVLYVDLDPLAVAHSTALLGDNPRAAALQADARRPATILADPLARRLIDFDRPVGVLLLALLHFVTDDDEAYELVRVLRDALPSGSYLAISHATYEDAPREVLARVERLYVGTTNPARARSRAEIARFFAGLELVEPGLAPVPLWRPDEDDRLFRDEPARSLGLAGVGYKP